jgi:hypothetical protein
VLMISFDQISGWTSFCQSLVIFCNGFYFCRALICWGKCAWQVAADSYGHYQSGKMS